MGQCMLLPLELMCMRMASTLAPRPLALLPCPLIRFAVKPCALPHTHACPCPCPCAVRQMHDVCGGSGPARTNGLQAGGEERALAVVALKRGDVPQCCRLLHVTAPVQPTCSLLLFPIPTHAMPQCDDAFLLTVRPQQLQPTLNSGRPCTAPGSALPGACTCHFEQHATPVALLNHG